MISHFPVTPPQPPPFLSPFPFASMRVLPNQPMAPASPYTGASNLHWTKGLPSHCWPASPSPERDIWSHRSLQVHSLVSGLVPGRTGWSCQPIISPPLKSCFFPVLMRVGGILSGTHSVKSFFDSSLCLLLNYKS